MSVPAGPTVVLCGPPGSGKTATGRVLATLLGLPFHDTDEAIVASVGRSIADIFVEDGEPAFRALERAEVARALEHERGVLAVGGGAVMDPATEQRLRGHAVVFLDVAPADAARRVGLDATARPMLAVTPRAAWRELMAQRRQTYRRVGTIHVDTTGRTPPQVAELVAAALSEPSPARP